jgi:hypothetical protein
MREGKGRSSSTRRQVLPRRPRQGSADRPTFTLASGKVPIDLGLIFPVASSVLVCGREQLLL